MVPSNDWRSSRNLAGRHEHGALFPTDRTPPAPTHRRRSPRQRGMRLRARTRRRRIGSRWGRPSPSNQRQKQRTAPRWPCRRTREFPAHKAMAGKLPARTPPARGNRRARRVVRGQAAHPRVRLHRRPRSPAPRLRSPRAAPFRPRFAGLGCLLPPRRRPSETAAHRTPLGQACTQRTQARKQQWRLRNSLARPEVIASGILHVLAKLRFGWLCRLAKVRPATA